MKIVCYTLKLEKDQFEQTDYTEDHFEVFDTFDEAKELYDKLIKTGAYSVTICDPLESTELHYIDDSLNSPINHKGQISVKWCREDVIEQAKNFSPAINLTDEEVDHILFRLVHYHDASIGISWDTLDFHIDDVVSERKEMSK